MRKVLFRVDGYSEIGYGHLVRSLALAEELRERGNLVYFLAFADDFCCRMMDTAGVMYIKTSNRAGERYDLEYVRDLLSSLRIDIFIHDSYSIGLEYEKGLGFDGLIVAIDDVAERSFYSDVIVNQNFGAKECNYVVSKSDVRLLLGPEYVILRDSILRYKRRAFNTSVENILIIFGGADRYGQSLRVARILSKCIREDIKINVVIRGNHYTSGDLHMLAKRDRRVFVVHDVCDIGELLSNMDLAISASGSSLWELLYVGVPVISLILADNQEKTATRLSSKGYIKLLGWYNSVSDEDISREVRFLIERTDERRKFFERGQRLIDGKGKMRIGEILLSLFR